MCSIDHDSLLADHHWNTLPFVGIQPDHDDTGKPQPLELRNCIECHSTIARRKDLSDAIAPTLAALDVALSLHRNGVMATLAIAPDTDVYPYVEHAVMLWVSAHGASIDDITHEGNKMTRGRFSVRRIKLERCEIATLHVARPHVEDRTGIDAEQMWSPTAPHWSDDKVSP